MSEYKIIRTLPGEPEFDFFTDLPKKLYSENSPRFKMGNDPVTKFLEACYVMFRDNEPVGRFALYENPEMKYEGIPAMCIGSFECINDFEVSRELLSAAILKVGELGYNYLIGPMEGSTWNNYRFSDHNNIPNFFMEPYHHEYYPELFKEFGFSVIADYVSNLDTEVTVMTKEIEAIETEYKKAGARFRNLNMDDLEEDLFKIAAFSNEAFQNNFLFTPIEPSEFVAKYVKLKDLFNPELVFIVEDEKEIIQAISFTIKDYNFSVGNSLIIKTLARRNNSPFKGIGYFLGHKTYQIAVEKGFDNVIHALMYQENTSVKLSSNYHGHNYKSYSLFGLEI